MVLRLAGRVSKPYSKAEVPMEVRLAGHGERAGETATVREGGDADGLKVGGQGERAGEAATVAEGGGVDGGDFTGNGE